MDRSRIPVSVYSSVKTSRSSIFRPLRLDHVNNLGSFLGKVFTFGGDFLFRYETPKIVNIHSKRIGALYRVVQVAIIAYVIGYVFIYNKGYQDTERVESSVVTKIKGVIRTKFPHPLNMEIWDSVDFVIPPQENNAFFIATNVVGTPDQQQGSCPENFQDKNLGSDNIECESDEDCPQSTVVVNGNGFRTGKCSNSTNSCMISAWCPVEIDVRPVPAALLGSENFTILVKNQVVFPKFDLKRRNILESMNTSYLMNCRYHPINHPYCPIFVLSDILHLANESYSEIAERGGVMGFVIEWNCDLDYTPEDCLPRYSFRRMDDKKDKLAKGWNFRHAHYWTDTNGTQRRTLLKVYGIRFVFNVYGKAGKFSLVVFAMNLGSGIGLLGIATILCDFVLLNCLKNRDTFNEFKFLRLESKYLQRDSGSTVMRNQNCVNSELKILELPLTESCSPYSNPQVASAIDDDLTVPLSRTTSKNRSYQSLANHK